MLLSVDLIVDADAGDTGRILVDHRFVALMGERLAEEDAARAVLFHARLQAEMKVLVIVAIRKEEAPVGTEVWSK